MTSEVEALHRLVSAASETVKLAARMQAALTQIVAIHDSEGSVWCQVCGRAAPCPTVVAIREHLSAAEVPS